MVISYVDNRSFGLFTHIRQGVSTGTGPSWGVSGASEGIMWGMCKTLPNYNHVQQTANHAHISRYLKKQGKSEGFW